MPLQQLVQVFTGNLVPLGTQPFRRTGYDHNANPETVLAGF